MDAARKTCYRTEGQYQCKTGLGQWHIKEATRNKREQTVEDVIKTYCSLPRGRMETFIPLRQSGKVQWYAQNRLEQNRQGTWKA